MIHNYFCNPFDEDGSILRKSAAKKGVSPEELQKEWTKAKDDSCVYGTRLHEQFEHYIKTNQIKDTDSKDIVKEFSKIRKTLKGTLLSEEILYDLDYGIAGCSDLIHITDNSYDLLDFKSNKKISQFSFGKYMKYPLNKYPDCNYYHYLVQLNTYAYLFEKRGFWPESIKLLWINPKTRKIEPMEMEFIFGDIKKMLDFYKKNHFTKKSEK